MPKIPNHSNFLTKRESLHGLCKNVLEKNDNNAELMTEAELIQFLRIPEISNSKDYHNVIEHLKKFRGLPRIHICRKALYLKKAILEWLEKETDVGK